jgi:hypothetical protein
MPRWYQTHRQSPWLAPTKAFVDQIAGLIARENP